MVKTVGSPYSPVSIAPQSNAGAAGDEDYTLTTAADADDSRRQRRFSIGNDDGDNGDDDDFTNIELLSVGEYTTNPMTTKKTSTSIVMDGGKNEDAEEAGTSVAVAAVYIVPNMWSLEYIGLFSQYAAVGLLYGSAGTLLPFCVYVYDGPANVCSNSSSIFLFPWSFKLLFAVVTDSYRPWGMRRRPWMILGWVCVLAMLFILAVSAKKLTVSTWLTLQLAVQGFMMFSDVPADGYSVEMGKLESAEQRGQVLATGQRVRFLFSLLAGAIQTFLLNGLDTNPPGCAIAFDHCWSWGLDIQGYYGLLFAIVAVLVIPIFWLKEPPAKTPVHTLSQFAVEIWDTLQSQTTLYLIVYAIGIGALTNFPSIASVYMQYYVIGLTNFQAGIDTITSYAALVAAVWIFQRYLIQLNWRITHYSSSIFASVLGLLWLLPYHRVGHTRDPWFTIFIDLDQAFVNGLSQVLYSMAVIEVSKPGQEATTYELVITVNNAAIALSGVLATQVSQLVE